MSPPVNLTFVLKLLKYIHESKSRRFRIRARSASRLLSLEDGFRAEMYYTLYLSVDLRSYKITRFGHSHYALWATDPSKNATKDIFPSQIYDPI